MQWLAGDIGATKTELGIFSTRDGASPITVVAEKVFPSADYSSFEELVRDFLSNKSAKTKVTHACFGVAGPILNGRSKLTNLSWVIDEKELMESFDFKAVKLLNDIEATAYYVPSLKPQESVSINEGEGVYGGTIGVVAVGTGLGEAFLTWDGKRYLSHASEGGHCDYAPNNNPEERGLLEFLSRRFGHVSFERVCSGKGLYNIYSYFHSEGVSAGSSCPSCEAISKSEDPARLIIEEGVLSTKKKKEDSSSSSCPDCVRTIDTFSSILGAEAGNLALKVLATNGIYIGGGIPPRMVHALSNGRLAQAFLDKGRMSDLVSKIPLNVILNPRAALLGAARYGQEMASSRAMLFLREEEVEKTR